MYHLDLLSDPYFLPDPSGAQMVLTIKLTSFAFNILDGKSVPPQAGTPQDPSKQSPNDRILQERRSRAILHIPGPLEYFSYMLFFGGILTGPAFDFVEFSSSLDHSKYTAIKPPTTTTTTPAKEASGKVKIPSPVGPALMRLLGALVFLSSYLLLQNIVTFRTLSEDLDGRAFSGKLLLIMLAAFGEKSKYFFVWLMAEAGCVLCSLGFAGYAKDASADWSGLSNIDIGRFEFAESVRDVTVYWNKNTGLWLRRYVYERLPSPFNLLATYFVSAFWHGFYPGYYLFFFTIGFAQDVTRRIRQKVRPYFMEADGKTPTRFKIFYDFLGFVFTYFWTSYAIISYQVMHADKAFEIWGKLYFFGHIMLLIPLVVLPLIPSVGKRPAKQD